MKYKKRIVPANRSPETIMNLVSLVLVTKNSGMGYISIEHISIEGTLEERLAQYKAATGKEWNGHGEQVFSEPIETEPVSLNLGQKKFEPVKSKADIEVQEKIDALAAKAHRWVLEARAEKHKKKLITKREEMQASGVLA